MMMNRKEAGRCVRRFLLILFAFILGTLSVPATVLAEETLQIPVRFADPGNPEILEWEFPYSDEWFLTSDEVFNRELAKGSMGLAVSAFMPDEEAGPEPRVETYLSGAGFEMIRTFGYDQPIGTDTLAGIIGRKSFDGFTLIAVAGRGSGYGKEWGGNLRLGSGVRHEGFRIAAGILEEELDRYLAENPAEGPVKLWVTGYSRSSAAGNLAAADWTESGRFEDVYGYFFACPRNTREPLRAPNLFNICGAQDFVTQIPMQRYGYERNGTDLFLPSQETTSGYARMKLSAAETLRELTGHPLTNNPELNLLFRLTVSLLTEIFRTQDEYVNLLQDQLLAGIPEEGISSTASMVPDLISSFVSLKLPDGRSFYTTSLAELGTELTVMLLTGKGKLAEEGRWDPDATTFENVFREHLVSTYLCWMFSDLPDEKILTEASPERILFLYKCDSVTMYRGDETIRILEKGNVQKDAGEAAVCVKTFFNTVMIILPAEEESRLEVTTKDGKLCGLEVMITPSETLCDSCFCYLSETPQAGPYEMTACGAEPFTDGSGGSASFETAAASCGADDLIDMISIGFSGKENRELVTAAFGD